MSSGITEVRFLRIKTVNTIRVMTVFSTMFYRYVYPFDESYYERNAVMSIIDDAIIFIQELFQGRGDGHDADHTLRVYHNAQIIAEHYDECDVTLVSLAALLHDVDDPKLFVTENNANARRFLEGQGVEQERIERICDIINAVSFSKNKGKRPDTIEGMIVQDADRLDAIGAIGIARTFAYGGKHERSLDSSVAHFYEKLLLLKGMMNTSQAGEMAEDRHRFMEEFLRELESEIGS